MVYHYSFCGQASNWKEQWRRRSKQQQGHLVDSSEAQLSNSGAQF